MKKVFINGEIGWDVTSRDIVRQLNAAKGEPVQIEMATPGGSVYEGLKIYNEIKNYAGDVTIKLMGLVASMGSYIALARGAENVIAEDNSIFMIHNVSAGAYGDYRVAHKLYTLLNSLTGHLANVYSRVSGKDIKETRSLMDEEKYFYGQQIVDNGFAGQVVDGEGEKDPDSLLATAKLAVQEVMAKVRAAEVKPDEIEGIANVLGKLQDSPPAQPVSEATEEEPETENEEVSKMNLEELKTKNRGLYDQVLAIGREEGVSQERARVSQITGFRAKLPTACVNVVDEAIKNGDDFQTFSLNASCAMANSEEVTKGKHEQPQTPTGSEQTTPAVPMKDGDKITSPEQAQETSNFLAKIAGITN